MDSLIMQHSPKAGVFNKLKKKLSKGRRYEVGSTGEETDAIKLQKFEAMYARFPTQGDGGPKSRDSSPSIMDIESPKRSVLDSPQRANLSEKDINKTNTYTKDPTKEQKKNGSPTKEVKSNKGAGPIIFINNTYDLPPILPVKKGAISDKRQRSKERHKDQISNKDGKKGDTDKQAVRSDNAEENKENSKVGSKSPHKSKSRGGSMGGVSRPEAGTKGASVSEEGVSSGCNSSGSSGDGKIKCKDPDKSRKDQEYLRDSVETTLKTLIKCEESRGCTNGQNHHINDRSPKIIPLLNDEKSIWGSEKGRKNCSINGFGNKQQLGDDTFDSSVNNENNGEAPATAKGQANEACHDNDLEHQKNPPGIKKANVREQGYIVNGDGEVLPTLIYRSQSEEKKELEQPPVEKQGHKSPATGSAENNKSDVDILQKENGSDKSIITERGKGNRGEDGMKNKGDTSHAKLHDVPLFRPLTGAKIPVKGEVDEIKSQSNSNQGLDEELDDNDSDDDMELGYTSLADVEKIFGNKKEASDAQEAASKAKVTAEGLLLRQSLFARDSNGNVMRGPGCVIKCDVNVQGCDVRPLLVDRLASARFQGCCDKNETKVTETELPSVETEENEYGSIGDYSSRNVCQNTKPNTNNPNMGARPKQKTISRNSTVTKESPVLKITKEMSKLPGFHGSSSPEIQKHFDLNLNLEVERGISHESGYETGGSGLRSHSSSSNEFIQNDSSSYSLVSEPSEDSSVPVSVSNSTPPVNLNDSTSSEEANESKSRSRPECRDNVEESENTAILASLYAFVPKGSQRGNDTSNVDCENVDSENSGGSSEKTESQHSITRSIQSPDSIKLEDTLIDDYDSEPYDDVDYGFEDGDEEDDDYLPPIPTRNYANEEQRLLEIKQCVETTSGKSKPPMMTVIGSKKSKEDTDKTQVIKPVEETQSEVLDLSVKKFSDTVAAIPKKTTVKDLSIAVKSKPIPIVNNQKNIVSTESMSAPDITTSKSLSAVKAVNKSVPEVAQKDSIVKCELSDVKSAVGEDCNGKVSAQSGKKSNLSKSCASKSETEKASCSQVNCSAPSPIATLKTTQADVHRNASYSPVRRKSYEKVERSTPRKEPEKLSDSDPKSPVCNSRESRSSSSARMGRQRKESETGKDAKDISNKNKSPDHKAGPFHDKKNINNSNTSLDSSKASKDDLRKSILENKPEKKTGDSPSKTDELYNQSFSSDSTLSLDQPFWASFDEPVHMSMEEVLNQAKDLGIPLALPSGSPSKDSSSESICSHNHRYNTQTLPCPRHGVITQDKLPKKKPGTLKDKFASLFTRKSGSSTSPKHSDIRGAESIQRRSLPPPPSSNDLDVVDGSISPQKGRSRNSKSICEIHGASDISRTLSPSHRFGQQSDSCCCHCDESDCTSHTGRYNKHKVVSSCYDHQQPHSSHRNACVHECLCHISPCKNTCKCQHGNYKSCHEGSSEGQPRHHHGVGHHTMCAYPRHQSSSRHGNQLSPDKRHRRDRSHSRDVTLRSRSPNTHILPLSKQSSSGQKQAYLTGMQPRQSRSSSSSGRKTRV